MTFVYSYPELQPGQLIKRYKRFLADVALPSGEIVTAHCPNTGPMTGIYQPDRPVFLSPSDNPKRKLAYTWEMIEIMGAQNQPIWVGTNTNLPNRVIKTMLINHLLPEVGDYDQVKAEVPYGRDRKSRIDFLLSGGPKPIYVEVKNTTWNQGSLALFPDTVTTRGQKHLRELMAIQGEGIETVMLYFINRSDCDRFAPGTAADPEYGALFAQALAQGVKILPCRFEVTPAGLSYLGLAPLDLEAMAPGAGEP